MIAVFLGAGFSRTGGVPLAAHVFDDVPDVDRVGRQRLVQRVVSDWQTWHEATGGAPEEYLAHLQGRGGRKWREAVRFVGLVIALTMGRLEVVGYRQEPRILRHNIDRTTGLEAHEGFWTSICRRERNLAVITTNYDVLIERGLRHTPRPRRFRPGFHYGFGAEELAGGGGPYSPHARLFASGAVPVLKLHGSISWSLEPRGLVHYRDCRPAIRGDPAIVAPVTEKSIPNYLEPVWHQAAASLRASRLWLVVGYSLPAYDRAVRALLEANGRHAPEVHVFDPNPTVAERVRELLPAASVEAHLGLPEGLAELENIALEEEAARPT